MKLPLTTILMLFVMALQAQNLVLKGKIVDEDSGESLSNAHITLQKSGKGAVTDVKGEFSLKVAEKRKYTLKVSYVGYKTKSLTLETGIEKPPFLTIRLTPSAVEAEEMVITANRSGRSVEDVPARVEVLRADRIKATPAHKIDQVLQYVPGVHLVRTSGIYDMRPVVSMRGLSGDEQGRVLVLVDGIPLNKGDTGGVNWNRIDMNNIEKVEILKGPASFLYGSSAMGGVINIVTRKPVKKISGLAEVSYRTYNTLNTGLSVNSRITKKLWTSVSGFYNSSDGYNLIPDSLREAPDYTVDRFVKELGTSVKAGYEFSSLFNLELRADYFDDERGEGEKIRAEDGEHRDFDTEFYSAKLSGSKKAFAYQLSAYYQKENYRRIDERMRNGEYSRFDVNSDRIDQGLILHSTLETGGGNILSGGVEMKFSSVDGGDFYKTSPDSILNAGKMQFTSFYLQDELGLFANKLKITAGLRFDHARFYDGEYYTTDGAWTDVLPELDENDWVAFSPRLAAKYLPSDRISFYGSYSEGFRASILDDLCRSGWMWVGPKVANPELGPEKLHNYEAGMTYHPDTRWEIAPSLYYSKGKDFLYYVASGDSLWGKRPIYRRENVTEVDIYGAELSITYRMSKDLSINTGYTYNRSEIGSFEENPELEGKTLKYVPEHMTVSSLTWTNRYVDLTLAGIYRSRQFTDDENDNYLDEYVTFDARASKTFATHFTAMVSIEDVFDNERMISPLYRSPGRIVSVGLQYGF